MARPKKPDEEVKSVWRTFRLTPDQAKIFRKVAANTGLTQSELARVAAIGMKRVYISDDLLEEARDLSRKLARIGNLLRLHATLLEHISNNPSLTNSDRGEIIRTREKMSLASAGINDLQKQVIELRAEVRQLHGHI